MNRRGATMTRRRAEEIAVAALGFLAADGERLGAFLAAAGLSVEGLRTAAASPGFLAGVMDHLASDERLLLAFSREFGAAPEVVLEGWRLLSGSQEPP